MRPGSLARQQNTAWIAPLGSWSFEKKAAHSNYAWRRRPKVGERRLYKFDSMRRSCIGQSEDLQLRSTQTIVEVQAREILTASELTRVRDFLCDADMLVTEVKSLFFNTGDPATAARLKDIQGRLSDENSGR